MREGAARNDVSIMVRPSFDHSGGLLRKGIRCFDELTMHGKIASQTYLKFWNKGNTKVDRVSRKERKGRQGRFR
jgi:hypothetical protein